MANIAQISVDIARHDGTRIDLPLFTLLQWFHALKLEALGVKVARRSVTAHVRRVLGTPGRYPRADLITMLGDILAVVEGAVDAE